MREFFSNQFEPSMLETTRGGYSALKVHFFYLTIFLLLCLFSTIINSIPEGYVIAHGDHTYVVESVKNYSRLFYLWGHISNGAGGHIGSDPALIINDGFFSMLDSLGVSATLRLNVKYFLFLFLGGLSAYIATGIFFKSKATPLIRFIASIFYSFNGLIVLYMSSIGGYITYYDLHLSLPLLWVLFVRGLIDRKNHYLIITVILMFVSVSGFFNPAFLILFLIFLSLTVLFCWLTRQIEFKQVLTATGIFCLYFLVLGFFKFNLVYFILSPLDPLKAENTFDLLGWIKGNAKPIISSLRLVYYTDNFPELFPYFFSVKPLFILLGFYPSFFISLSLLLNRDKSNRKWLLFFSVFFLIMLAVEARLPGVPFLLTLPILNVLRSWDKILVLLPFVYMVFLVYLLQAVMVYCSKKTRVISVGIIIASILLYPLPMFIGKFHTTFSRSYLWNYRYNVMVKIPRYYKDMANYVNEDKDFYKIVTMPYSGTIGIGWVLYPTWKFLGVDFTRLYFANPVYSPIPDRYQFSYAKYLSEHPIEGRDSFIDLLRAKGARYLVVNKDSKHEEKFLQSFWQMFNGVKKHFILFKKIGNLELYRIKPENELPVFYLADDLTPINSGDTSLIPFAKSGYLSGFPALVFAGQKENTDFLIKRDSLLGDKQIFANMNFNDSVIEMTRSECSGKGGALQRALKGRLRTHEEIKTTANVLKPACVALYGPEWLRFRVDSDGLYEVWVRGVSGLTADVDMVDIDGAKFRIDRNEKIGSWLKVGVVNLKKGKSRIRRLSREDVKGSKTNDQSGIEVLVVPEIKRRAYEDLLKLKKAGYLFYKNEDESSRSQESRLINNRRFYITKGGEYEVSALIKPKRDDVSAYAVKEGFSAGLSGNWTMRTDGGGRIQKHSPSQKVSARPQQPPVFMFGDNFSPPQVLSFPLMDGMWRWMSNHGKILIFNPYASPLKVDISFKAISYKDDRELRVLFNSRKIKTVEIRGPEKRIEKDFLKRITSTKDLSKASGKPQRIELKDVALKPGVNAMLLNPVPSAALVGRDNRFFVSVAVGDDLRISPVHNPHETTPWSNKPGFGWRIEGSRLLLEGKYMSWNDDLAWVTRSFDKIDLYDYPLFIMDYSWSDNQIQAMDIGFRVDTDGDSRADRYFVRKLPDVISDTSQYEIDLVKEIWRIFPDAVSKKCFLVGIDLFPHRQWRSSVAGTIKEGVYNYYIKGLQVASRDASVVVADRGAFDAIPLTKANYYLSQDKKELNVSTALGGRKGTRWVSEFRVRIKKELAKKAPLILLPYELTDWDVQSVNLWVGYDRNGDGNVDGYVPFGNRLALSNWRLITKDMKEPMLMYETTLPDDFPSQYSTKGSRFNNFILLKDNKPLPPTWGDNFRISNEEVQVDKRRVVINLPRNVDPDEFNYVLFYVPGGLIKKSPRYPDFREYVLEYEKIKDSLPSGFAEPVELKVMLEGRLEKNVKAPEDYVFYFKAPMYTYPLLPKLSNISIERNMPRVVLDSRIVEFKEKHVDRDRDTINLKTKTALAGGFHRISLKEDGALEAYMVEIKPAVSMGPVLSVRPRPVLKVRKINPTRYIVNVKGANGLLPLIFSESFHKGWKAYVIKETLGRSPGTEREGGREESWSAVYNAWVDRGVRTEITDHFVANGYANGWLIDPDLTEGRKDFNVLIEYKPQRLFEFGAAISFITFLGCVGYLFCGSLLQRRKRF